MPADSVSPLLVLDVDHGRCARLSELLSAAGVAAPAAAAFKVVQPTAEALAAASPYHPPASFRSIVLELAESDGGAGAAAAALGRLCGIESLGRYVHRAYPVCGSCGGRAGDEPALLAAILAAAGGGASVVMRMQVCALARSSCSSAGLV